MADEDLDEKKGDGLRKAASVATDASGKKPDSNKQDNPEEETAKGSPTPAESAGEFADAKKKS